MATDTATRPYQATIEARLTRAGIDTVEEIDYDGGQFTRHVRVLPGATPGVTSVLNDEQLRALLDELRAELRTAPPGIDLVGVEVFTDLIEDALRDEPPPSTRFDQARFGPVTRDETGAVLYGHVGLGVDVAGTVRDLNHELSFEQHVVIFGPGPFRPLSAADGASLARALESRPPADPLWKQILPDAASETARVARRFAAQKYPDLVAAGGRITLLSSPAAPQVLPRFDAYLFAVGSAYPLTTKPLARHTLLVDRQELRVVLDLDSTLPDATVAVELRGSAVLPAADAHDAADVAGVVATLAPLDPFFANPTTGGFEATVAADGTIQAVWAGDRFRYEVDFATDGSLATLSRKDERIKPI